MTVWVAERIVHWFVTALLAVWLYLLTDWVTWMDAAQGVLFQSLDQIREELQRLKI